jgi:hypothetical protein
MNYTPRTVFTGTGTDGNKITMMQWDFNTWAQMQAFTHIYYLLIGLLISAILPPILLAFAIYYFDGRNKGLYIIGIILSSYFLYDCSHGWIVLCAINLFFDESTINYLVGLNVASLLLFCIFLIGGVRLNNFIEDNFTDLLDRWCIFLGIIIIIGGLSTAITVGEKNRQKGWVMTNIKTESESGKKDRIERERREEIGDFESKEARDKHFDELQRRYGN